jgi:hypothetical protein
MSELKLIRDQVESIRTSILILYEELGKLDEKIDAHISNIETAHKV